jgi:hypothetical protein
MGDDSALSDVSFSSLTVTLSRTMRKYKFRIPPYYTLIIRSLGVLEGVALTCDPQFKVRPPGFKAMWWKRIGRVEMCQILPLPI